MKVVSYRSLGVRYDLVERFLIEFEDGSIGEKYGNSIDPYYHFNYNSEFQNLPKYNPNLRLPK